MGAAHDGERAKRSGLLDSATGTNLGVVGGCCFISLGLALPLADF